MPSQGLSQVQKQTQSLVLAPQLRQSLKILQVPTLELRNVILEELQTNPALEELPMDEMSLEAHVDDKTEKAEQKETEETALSENGTTDGDLDFSDEFNILRKLDEDWQNYFREEAGEYEFTSDDAKRRQHFFDSLTGDTSLQENLMEQARLQEADDETMAGLEYLVGSLDNNGFLNLKLNDVALLANLPLKKVQEAARLLKTLEPAGIGAENIRECLLIQLKAQNRGKSLAASIIRDHWDLLKRRRLPDLARKLGVSVDMVQSAVEEISRLDPAPGRRFSDDTNRVIVADVTVEQDDNGEWIIHLNNDYIPRLRISTAYKQMLAKGVLKGKEKEYIQDKFRSGKFLINSIEQRQQTIERITRELLKFQSDFFEYGTSQLRPLTMSQVADAVGVHETTVSRAIANKYIRTPQGVFEFKYFFTPGYQGQDGQAVSNKSVKERIGKIIEGEPPNKPYSDQAIVEILKEEGVSIARRTVAKYREEMGILPTNLRRRYA
ncbi:MAG: RNA polymerase factor sigma-54 [Verrucomicrobiota bacterium JB022]|nr:RNA polymerase factor sigma-54 [Verrucomicrobiota bacterium JB022]